MWNAHTHTHARSTCVQGWRSNPTAAKRCQEVPRRDDQLAHFGKLPGSPVSLPHTKFKQLPLVQRAKARLSDRLSQLATAATPFSDVIQGNFRLAASRCRGYTPLRKGIHSVYGIILEKHTNFHTSKQHLKLALRITVFGWSSFLLLRSEISSSAPLQDSNLEICFVGGPGYTNNGSGCVALGKKPSLGSFLQCNHKETTGLALPM